MIVPRLNVQRRQEAIRVEGQGFRERAGRSPLPAPLRHLVYGDCGHRGVRGGVWGLGLLLVQ